MPNYLTKAEMAKELIFCMETINQRNSKIEILEEEVKRLTEEIEKLRPEADKLREEINKLKPSPGASLLNTIRHQMDQLPKPQPVTIPSTTLKIRERKGEPTMPPVKPSPTSEQEIVQTIKKNLEVQDKPKRKKTEKTAWSDSKRNAICVRCGAEFTHTKRDHIPQRCPACETFTNSKCPAKEMVLAPIEENPFKKADAEPWKYEILAKQCDTCVYGKPCANPKDGVNGHECMKEVARICKPGLQSNHYLGRIQGVDL